MNKILLTISFSFLSLFLFSQKLEGEWKLTQFNSSESIRFTDFSDCFWCQLPEQNPTLKIEGNKLTANLNQEEIIYNLIVDGNLLELSKIQNVYITPSDKSSTVKSTMGKTVFEFEKKGKTLVLKDYKSSTKNSYTFQLK